MEKLRRGTLPTIKLRQRAKIDRGLATQDLTPKRIRELVCSAIGRDGVGDAVDKHSPEPVRVAKTRHSMFWQEEEF